MFVAAGTGNWVAAIFHLGTHAFFKACLFLGAGSVMHGMEHGGSTHAGRHHDDGRPAQAHADHADHVHDLVPRDRRHLPVRRASSRRTRSSAARGASHPPGWPAWYGKVLWGGLLLAALGTAFYMWRLYFLVFSGEERSEEAKHAHESPRVDDGRRSSSSRSSRRSSASSACRTSTALHLPAFTHALVELARAERRRTTWYDSPDRRSRAGRSRRTPSDATTLVADGHRARRRRARHRPRVDVLRPRPVADRRPGSSTARSPAAYDASKHKLWFDEIYDAIIVRPFRVVARGLLRDRRSLHHRHGRGQRHGVRRRAVRPAVAVVPERSGPALPRRRRRRRRARCSSSPTAIASRRSSYAINGDQLKLHAEPGAGVVGASAKLALGPRRRRTARRTRTRPARAAPTSTIRAGDVGAQRHAVHRRSRSRTTIASSRSPGRSSRRYRRRDGG